MYTGLVNILPLIILFNCFDTELSIGITGNVSLSKPLLSNQVYTLCKYRRRWLQPALFSGPKKAGALAFLQILQLKATTP